MKLVKALGSIGSLTLASRVLALVRDALQARYVGAGFASDAFLVAFRLPNQGEDLVERVSPRAAALGFGVIGIDGEDFIEGRRRLHRIAVVEREVSRVRQLLDETGDAAP